jgi:hypothetical protein
MSPVETLLLMRFIRSRFLEQMRIIAASTAILVVNGRGVTGMAALDGLFFSL